MKIMYKGAVSGSAFYFTHHYKWQVVAINNELKIAVLPSVFSCIFALTGTWR
jgi:hypothetical protein